MDRIDPADERAILARIQAQAAAEQIQVSDHAQGKLVREVVTLAELREAIAGGRVLENYPTFFKGPCCLLYGDTRRGRPLHIVCSTTLRELVIITVYEPVPPKWTSPTRRG